eukprot:CAMPEP_0194560792 /NCGR_PEP_ID=MMETSP0292-20121207/1827_1 /TAXON_ID=39354 /ORGANISM="Heterosigma akashiwo, Strain CCMP2393" /LENGTH=46 /DNA_ID= /DNA_START= /DNA_END= /DNA_ORIENTATION=
MGKALLAYICEMYLHRYFEESASSFLEVGYTHDGGDQWVLQHHHLL